MDSTGSKAYRQKESRNSLIWEMDEILEWRIKDSLDLFFTMYCLQCGKVLMVNGYKMPVEVGFWT
jgi:NADH:ubiquinone oxidoreductase subunit B-like Fe-S oxidoreductase